MFDCKWITIVNTSGIVQEYKRTVVADIQMRYITAAIAIMCATATAICLLQLLKIH